MPKKVTPRGKAASAPKKTTARKTTTKKAPAKRGSTQRYIRAIYSPAGGTRLTLNNGSHFELKPRGQIGDCAAVTKEDMLDPIYIQNKDMLFEEITAAEAKKVMEKQVTNAQAPRQNPLMGTLTNERGETYQQNDPTVEQAFEQQGKTVGHLQPAADGRFTSGNQDIARPMEPEHAEVPGSVEHPTSADQQMRNIQVPADIPPEQISDWIARNNPSNNEDVNAQADLGLRASIAPVQKDITP